MAKDHSGVRTAYTNVYRELTRPRTLRPHKNSHWLPWRPLEPTPMFVDGTTVRCTHTITMTVCPRSRRSQIRTPTTGKSHVTKIDAFCHIMPGPRHCQSVGLWPGGLSSCDRCGV